MEHKQEYTRADQISDTIGMIVLVPLFYVLWVLVAVIETTPVQP